MDLKCLLYLILGLTNFVFASSPKYLHLDGDTLTTSNTKGVKIVGSLLFPTRIGVEIGLGHNLTCYPNIGYDIRLKPSDNDGTWGRIYAGPSAEIELRKYTNPNELVRYKLSSEYISVSGVFAYYASQWEKWHPGISVKYGFQKDLSQHAFVGFSIGGSGYMSIYGNKPRFDILPILNVQLGLRTGRLN